MEWSEFFEKVKEVEKELEGNPVVIKDVPLSPEKLRTYPSAIMATWSP